MSYTVDYNVLQEPQKSQKALSDAKAWLGVKQKRALKQYVKEGCTEDDFHAACSFAGISGFPVQVLYKHYKETVK